MPGVSSRSQRREGGVASALARGTLPLLFILLATLAHASDIDVSIDNARGTCRVHGAFAAPVSRELAWDVLADYDSIGRFVHSVRSSRMERQTDGRLLLRQDAVGGVFLVRRRMQVLLDIQEDPGQRIAFRDVQAKDFHKYVGAWRISADSGGTRVDYELEAEPRAAIMRAFCRGALRKAARDLLEQVRAEMMRRAAGTQ